MLTLHVRELDEARARLFARTSRVVGWGSGSVFDYFHGPFPIRLDYLVDNDQAKWGQSRGGVEIVGPDRLAAEDPNETVVVIYSSFWPTIQRQVQAIGGFMSLPASAAFADAATRSRLAWAEALAAEPGPMRRPRSHDAIVVQGPVDQMTVDVLRVLSRLHPADVIVLSTWDDTDRRLLAAVKESVDEVVLSARPAVGGIQNRNYQIVSTKAGIDCAIGRGARTILKTRTDLAVLGQPIFDQGRWLLGDVGSRAARAAGLRHRLIVPSSFTRKFLLYHPSDLVMLGTAEDMLQYWSAPLDLRSGELLSAARLDRPVSAVNMEGNPTESYLGLALCRSLGRATHGTVRDSWTFYRDLFAVVDNGWFDLLWFKNLSIPDAALVSGVRQTVSQSFWRRLDANDSSVEWDLAATNPHAIRLGALAGAA